MVIFIVAVNHTGDNKATFTSLAMTKFRRDRNGRTASQASQSFTHRDGMHAAPRPSRGLVVASFPDVVSCYFSLWWFFLRISLHLSICSSCLGFSLFGLWFVRCGTRTLPRATESSWAVLSFLALSIHSLHYLHIHCSNALFSLYKFGVYLPPLHCLFVRPTGELSNTHVLLLPAGFRKHYTTICSILWLKNKSTAFAID